MLLVDISAILSESDRYYFSSLSNFPIWWGECNTAKQKEKGRRENHICFLSIIILISSCIWLKQRIVAIRIPLFVILGLWFCRVSGSDLIDAMRVKLFFFLFFFLGFSELKCRDLIESQGELQWHHGQIPDNDQGSELI